MMNKRFIFLYITLAVFSQCLPGMTAEEKLNIGVKKRVKDCKVKSKHGDKLHMHYTVQKGKVCEKNI